MLSAAGPDFAIDLSKRNPQHLNGGFILLARIFRARLAMYGVCGSCGSKSVASGANLSVCPVCETVEHS